MSMRVGEPVPKFPARTLQREKLRKDGQALLGYHPLEEAGSPGTLVAPQVVRECAPPNSYKSPSYREVIFTVVWEILCFLEVVYKTRH